MIAKGRPLADGEQERSTQDWQPSPSNVTSSLPSPSSPTATTTLATSTTTAPTTTATLVEEATEETKETPAAITATTLEEGQAELVGELHADEEQPRVADETIRHLKRQLELRDRELQTLRLELERYKLALQQQQQDNKTAQDNDFIQDHLTTTTRKKAASLSSPSASRFKDDIISVVKQDPSNDIFEEVAQIDQLPFNDDDDDNKDKKVATERKDSKARPSILDDAKKVIKEKEMALRDEEEEEEGGGSEEDGLLLTSLTDAAISNLSQLAALQERCESQQQQHSTSKSQQHSSSNKQEKTLATTNTTTTKQAGKKHKSTTTATATTSPLVAHCDRLELATPSPSPVSPSGLSHDADNDDDDDDDDIGDSAVGDVDDNPFSLANQAALAISASNHQHHLSDSISPPNLNQTQSLASVVAAAAVAAAAANDHHQHHLHHHHQQRTSPHQTRLIPSAMASPDYYHPLHQHQSASSLPYSPSTSGITTPSPSSLMSTHHQQRRSISNASSNLVLSPIASPSFLRRQFMADSRMPMMSPSPTSLTTGSQSVSVASSSLAHLLQQHHHHHHHHSPHAQLQQSSHQQQHHHHQQRSASALGVVGPLSTVVAAAAASGTSASTPGSGSTAVSPLMSNKNSSQARLNNMQIRHKFGYLGSGRAQFNSPHGFCLGLNQEIVVADTNNHRICIFDKSGTYITQFGSPGKEEGQLWNPRKVAILHKPSILAQYYQQLEAKAREAGGEVATNNNNNSNSSSSSSLDQANQLQHLATHHHYQQHHHLHHQQQHQHLYPSHHHLLQHTNLHQHLNNNQQQAAATATTNQAVGVGEPLYVVCDRGAERSRMQLFTKDGAFIKKISIHFIDIVAGLAITQSGLIIVVDSVSPTVYIINGETGVLNGWFDCSGHMKEPSDIAVKSDVPRNEYFICDFKGHCVVVFSESGEYLRKIGHDGLTSYPNGIDISDDGDILVGDSHGNRFHVVVFDRNGNFVSQFECPHVKVSRCCGLKITREGYIVTLAKNNHHVLVLDTIHI